MNIQEIREAVSVVQTEVLGALNTPEDQRPKPPTDEMIKCCFALGAQYLVNQQRIANALEELAEWGFTVGAKKGKG